ncbi:MAG: FtsX-like permease family protein [Flavobacteriaceae bacterium]
MIEKNSTAKASFSWLLKMALRDGKASGKKLGLFMASIVLGIAAVVSIQSFGVNLKENIALQSKSLMGTDYKIDSNDAPNERIIAVLDSLGGADAREISFPSMVSFKGNEGTKLVQVRGIEGGFPFYGSIETDPPAAANSYKAEGGALLDATVMLQLNLKPGDSINIGNITIPISGSLVSIPGSTAVFSSVAPPVVLSYDLIEKTELVQMGSRVKYDFYFVAEEELDLRKLRTDLRPTLQQNNYSIDTHVSSSERLGRRFDNFGKFLNLVAFIALLLGCVGIASAIHIYIKEKLKAVAILKCLGATKRQTFSIYLLQIAGIGLLGGVIGTVLGLGLQQLFPLFLGDLLPVDVEITFSTQVIFMGILLGVFMSVLFALYPLMNTLYVSPLQALRVDEGASEKSRFAGLMVLLGIFVFIFLFSYWLLGDVTYSLAFVLGILITFSILAGVAHLFMRAIKRFFPTSWGFVARQSLLNLFRPQNQTLILILAIGVGTFLISTLYFTKDVLLAQASLESQENTPNIILLDVQSDQQQAVEAMISDKNLPVIENMPIVTMRLHAINEKTVNEMRRDTTRTIDRWLLNHEFRVSYRNELTIAETLVNGEWNTTVKDGEPVPISISDNLVRDAALEVGDDVYFNVQGVILHTRVSSVREVDWSRAQMNFMVVFPEGVLEDAPQFRVITAQTPDAAASAQLQQAIVMEFPNVTIIDIRQILTVVEGILEKISWLINFMAFFSIFTGIIVLLGAVRTSKYQRIRESVLLRTLGAQSRQILKITALEYFYLGVLGSLSGILLSLGGSQLLAWWVFETPFVPSWVPFLVLLPGITILVLAIGLSNSMSVIKSPPLEVLRREGS